MPTPQHLAIEAHFSHVLAEAGYAPPDRIVYEDRAVGFAYEEPKVIIFVDFDDAGPVDVRASEPERRAA
jgi:hypothetical protein